MSNHPVIDKNDIDENNTILELYKLHVEMADRVSRRRDVTNNWFITINASIISGLLFLITNDLFKTMIVVLGICLLGCALSYIWKNLIQSYKQLNAAKFKALDSLENNLPLKFYEIEYKAYKEVKRKDFSEIEKWIPQVLMAIYALGFLIGIGVLSYFFVR